MKLLVAVIPHASRKKVHQALLEASFQLTQFDSMGGYLGRRNSTFLLGVDDTRVDEAVKIIREACFSHIKTVSAPVLSSTDVSEAVVASDAAQVRSEGATIFVLPIDRFEKA